MDYFDYLRTVHWRTRRQQKLLQGIQIDRYQLCTECHCLVALSSIHVHHLPGAYARLWKERDSDLRILCEGCHALEHEIPPPVWWQESRDKHRSFSRAQLHLLIKQSMDRYGLALDEAIEAAITVLAPKVGPSPLGIGAAKTIDAFILQLLRYVDRPKAMQFDLQPHAHRTFGTSG